MDRQIYRQIDRLRPEEENDGLYVVVERGALHPDVEDPGWVHQVPARQYLPVNLVAQVNVLEEHIDWNKSSQAMERRGKFSQIMLNLKSLKKGEHKKTYKYK